MYTNTFIKQETAPVTNGLSILAKFKWISNNIYLKCTFQRLSDMNKQNQFCLLFTWNGLDIYDYLRFRHRRNYIIENNGKLVKWLLLCHPKPFPIKYLIPFWLRALFDSTSIVVAYYYVSISHLSLWWYRKQVYIRI